MGDIGSEERVDIRCSSQELYAEWPLSQELNDKWSEPCDGLKILVKSRKIKLFRQGGRSAKCVVGRDTQL